MYKIIIVFFALFASSAFAECTKLIQNHKYLLKSGIEYCLESKYSFVNIFNSESSSDFVEVSYNNGENYEMIYPGEQLIVPDFFKITTFSDMHLSVVDGLIYLESVPKIRVKRSWGQFGNAVGGAALGAVGGSLAGSEPNYVPVIVGTAIGTGAGLATGPFSPVVGPLVSNYITQNIINNNGKPRPPLTIINSRWGPSGSFGGGHGGGGGSNCKGCH
ncbi:TPA: hypothetical protein ACX6PX_000880 [Photobacterium damselae]